MQACHQCSAECPEEDAADHIEPGDVPAEAADEHGYGDFVDQRGGDEEGQRDTHRNAPAHQSDEEGDGGAGAEGGQRAERGGEQVLHAAEAVLRQEGTYVTHRKVGIEQPHQPADAEEQQQYLRAVVEEEADRGAGRTAGGE